MGHGKLSGGAREIQRSGASRAGLLYEGKGSREAAGAVCCGKGSHIRFVVQRRWGTTSAEVNWALQNVMTTGGVFAKAPRSRHALNPTDPRRPRLFLCE
jgi:hypothetical protein